ncbi:uncharacterized protein [Antedon mediterranea]|uniref:uncharacterized protein n=1 Tax=Antedon mediterranea TaxID=105859 RepID=UPI003AF808C3
MYSLMFLTSVFVLISPVRTSTSSSSWYSGDGPCGENEFTCLTSRDCIDSLFVCDKDEDCADGSDERNCTEHYGTQVGEFYSTTPEVTVDDAPVRIIYSTTIAPGPCHPDPCGRFGVCNTNFFIQLVYEEQFKCDCYNGHKGKLCDIEFCKLKCQNYGDCRLSLWSNEQYCDCEDGYDGDLCENDLCYRFCNNSGECLINSWTKKPYCRCAPGYAGPRCDDDLCDCGNNGRCEYGVFIGFHCECETGYGGKNCEKDLCDDLDCQNNGECKLRYGNKYYCDCPDGYYGKRCEKGNGHPNTK